MTWARLRSFLAVAETGSVRSAAARLSVTESAVSAAVAALQAEVGADLLERHGRGVRLTEAGSVYAGYVRKILGLLDEAAAAAAVGSAPERGSLRLGAVTTAGDHLLPGLLASFRRRYPAVDVTLEVGVRDRVNDLLADHQLDLVIGGRPPQGRGLVTRATRPNALLVVAAPAAAAGPGYDAVAAARAGVRHARDDARTAGLPRGPAAAAGGRVARRGGGLRGARPRARSGVEGRGGPAPRGR